MTDAAPAFEQVQPDEDHYRALLARRGWAPIAGGSPELDEEQAGGDPTPPETPEVEAPDTSTEAEESFTDFDISELPEDVRTAAEGIKKQFQGDYTRKMQDLAEERREAEQARQMFAALRNPQTQAQVLEQFGISLVDDEEPETAGEEPDIYDEVESLKQQIAEREQREAQAKQDEAVADYVAGEIAGLEDSAQRELSAEHHQAIDILARTRATPEGYPDVKWAYGLLSNISKAEVKEIVKGKDAPRPPGGGKPGSRQVDLSNESDEDRQTRMAHAIEQQRSSAQ